MELYHATRSHFTDFAPRPAWFSLNEKDALGWLTNGGGRQIIARYVGGAIADVKDCERLAKRVWPDEDLIYSMFDENVHEFDDNEVRAFIALLQAEGFDAAYIEDYDPNNFEVGTSTSLAVFRPDLHVVF
jgi:hypothetical protein